MTKAAAVYIMSSPNKGTLYIGMSSDLASRVWQHKNKVFPNSFSAKYNCVVLVYYRFFVNMSDAVAEEKRLKGGSRKQKEKLIDSINPKWDDLYDALLNEL